MLKQTILILLGIFTANVLVAQSYTIKEEAQRINSVKYPGVSSLVDGSIEKVEEYWFDYLKDYGKVRRKRNYYQVTEFSLKDLGNDTITYVTRVDSKDSLGLIWLAPFSQDYNEDELKSINKDLEKILKTATRGYYINEVQKKIDESEKAAIVVSKKHQKLLYEGENLVQDSLNAENLKAELAARLEETILKIKVINQQLIDNKEATTQAYEDLEKIKKIIEDHKQSLKKIK
jgi:uncharacterized protein YfkK (UPF0435 family)